MKNLTKQEKHEQCIREIRGTLVVVAICCAWHILSAFLLNGSGLYFRYASLVQCVNVRYDRTLFTWGMVFVKACIY